MKENREFDMLENANDNNVELLAEVPVLTKKEKERMLKMSKNKLNKMNRESNIEVQVSGVERYNRPKWYTFASIAACVVLVGGIVGTAVFLGRNGQTPDIDPMSGVSEPTTEVQETDPNENQPAVQWRTVVTGLFDKVNELNVISCGGGVETDESNSILVGYANGESAEAETYYLVTDSRFSSIDDVKAYFRQYVADPMFTSEYYTCFVDDFAPAAFVERDGKLYFLKKDDAQSKATNYRLDLGDELIKRFSDTNTYESYGSNDEKMDFSVPAMIGENACRISGKLVKDGGEWKISEFVIDFFSDESDTTETADAELDTDAVLRSLEEFDAITSGAGVKINTDVQKSVLKDDYTLIYSPVTDARFSSIAELKDYFAEKFTGTFLMNNEYIWSGDDALFREMDGGLFFLQCGRGGRFGFTGEPVIESNDGRNCVISVNNEIAGGYRETVKIECVMADGKWKVNSWRSLDGHSLDSEIDYQRIAETAVHDYYKIESIVYGDAFETDREDTFSTRKVGCLVTYIRVKSDEFTCVEDIMSFIRQCCCDDLLSSYENDMYIDDVERYIDENGKLYTVDIEKTTAPLFGSVESINPIDKAEDHFTFRVTETSGRVILISMKNIDGTWKIAEVSGE